MSNLLSKYFIILILILSTFFINNLSISQAIEFDLKVAKDSVGKRFASKFCEAKQEGFSSDSSSEFALNNTYLKFVAFPDDDKFIDDLWEFTIVRIRKECGEYVNKIEEANLRDFFHEEGDIATNRDLYLPH